MIEFGKKAIGQLENDDRQCHRKHQARNHKEQVVQNRVADIHDGVFDIRRQGQVLKVFKTNPRAVDETVDKPVLNPEILGRSGQLIIFERHDDAGHGQIGE